VEDEVEVKRVVAEEEAVVEVEVVVEAAVWEFVNSPWRRRIGRR
jgi:hypothetical protein